jgi:heat shock protein HslJ
MWQGSALKKLTCFIFLSFLLNVCLASEQSIRYRGQYTLGHEVNIFCPHINSQCYWLSPDIQPSLRQRLKTMAGNDKREAYEAICILVEASVNRNPEHKQDIGFARDYDGLITITKVFGFCNQSDIVTQGDLQHHRWILQSINNKEIYKDALNGYMPEIDFGEKMTVTGYSGCRQYSAQAELFDDRLRLKQTQYASNRCNDKQLNLEEVVVEVLNGQPKITIDKKNHLILKTENTKLVYYLNDWR